MRFAGSVLLCERRFRSSLRHPIIFREFEEKRIQRPTFLLCGKNEGLRGTLYRNEDT
jgi:hypothetical protein